MRILLFLAALGCSGDSQTGTVYDYTLTITPVEPLNQSPFSDLSRLDLVIEPSVGDPSTYTLSTAASGSSPTVTGLGPLDDATLALEGYGAADMVSFGRSDPVSAEDGEQEVRILVSEVDRFAWFNPLTTASFGGAMASAGDGKFLLFGGNGTGTAPSGETNVADTVWGVDVAPPDGAFTFSEVGTMPANDDGDSVRMAGTATTLENSDDAGLILVAGGTTSYFHSENALGDAFLWDPDAQEAVSQIALKKKRFYHQAVENQAGQILLIGGFARANEGYIGLETSVEIVDPETGETSLAVGDTRAGYGWTAAADIGSDGVLFCGGIADMPGGWSGTDACDLISNSGEIQGGVVTLPDSLMMASLAPLGDGKALLTGGLVTTGVDEVLGNVSLSATNAAWIYDNGTLTEVTDGMHVARAAHGSAALPDGKVLIFGGITGTAYGLNPSAADAIACAEIYDPDDGKFYEVDSCDATSTSSPLPSQTAFPIYASDPLYGVMTAGGLNPPTRYDLAASGVAWFVSCPDPEKC